MARLSTEAIFEAFRQHRITVELTPGEEIGSPWWSGNRYDDRGVAVGSDFLELHIASVILQPPKPTPTQLILQWLVLNFGCCERLRPLLGRWADDLTEMPVSAILSKWKKVRITKSRPYLLLPREFVLSHSAEIVGLPICGDQTIDADFSGKSSVARLGVTLHLSASVIHPDADPRVVAFELVNLGTKPLKLVPGMPIAQMVFNELHGTPQAHNGVTSGQRCCVAAESLNGSLQQFVRKN